MSEPASRNGRTFSIALLVSMTPLIAFSLARLFRWEDNAIVVLAQSFTPVILLPAYAVLAVAIALRLRMISAIAVFLVACHLVWIAPELRPARSLPEGISERPSLTVFSQNAKYDNESGGEELAASIRSSNADLVIIQELAPRAVMDLRASGALDAYPHEFLRPDTGARGLGTWSKVPFTDTAVFDEIVDTEEMPALRTTVSLHAQAITIWNIHTKSPPVGSGATTKLWRKDLEKVREYLKPETGRVIAVGDFNATWSHRPLREISDDGYRSVHIDRGRGYARTWPDSRLFSGGIIRIDHMFTRGDIRAVSISETSFAGSDHRGLLARIAVL